MKKSIMQTAVGSQWDELPQELKKHYLENNNGENNAEGWLSIDFPWFMKIPLSILRLFGALVNKKGKKLPTSVHRVTVSGEQRWHRQINFPDGKTVVFNSVVYYSKENEIIEYINSVLGMKMKVFAEGNTLRYESNGYIIKLWKLKIPYPEFLALGHASIVESESEKAGLFDMDFRLKHPLFGELFSYKGQFKTLT